ncbi:hypothetical protein [Streptomyces oceani]|uniref:Uncharacterized protein n=1 Tax=Streptomyces oceani TaxID=1075402 RepID=A0A1E7KQ50_9ACTN|nr:hypothetical protein [Streptomyces oceani]OEV06046.1 hypothetical protein AN216_00820 [Streptomyces oceani]
MKVARRVYHPSRQDRVIDPTVARIQVLRSVVGLVALVWAALTYQLVGDVTEIVDERFTQLVTSVVVLVVTFPVFFGLFLAAARPQARRVLLRRSVKPLGAMLAIIGSTAVLTGSVLGGVLAGQGYTSGLGMLLSVVLTFFLACWLLPFTFRGLLYSVVHVFRTADIHETVPPLLATLLVVEMTVVDLISGAYEGAPGLVRLALLLGPLISVGAVSLWELRRLRTRHGLTIRGALMR